jgi:hypothetical protein
MNSTARSEGMSKSPHRVGLPQRILPPSNGGMYTTQRPDTETGDRYWESTGRARLCPSWSSRAGTSRRASGTCCIVRHVRCDLPSQAAPSVVVSAVRRTMLKSQKPAQLSVCMATRPHLAEDFTSTCSRSATRAPT